LAYPLKGKGTKVTPCHCYARNPAHKKAIIKWLDGRFNTSQVQWYVDTDETGTHELEQLKKDVKANERPKTVVVYSLDQISPGALDFYVNLLQHNGRIVALNPQVDISGTEAANLILAVSKMEKEAWTELRAKGIAKAKQRGAYKGRKKGTRTLNIDVQQASALRQQGWSLDKIAEELNASRSSLARYLKATQDQTA
jgi:DNA invertase Pin-like site-specific DNA recombinase